ncbi:MAG: hypothetical protein DHS20C21_24560 [Gemmatimonadota bacterium]|nr:MAG: hypothetical protein DHS20C21_24560 [Gemmatimonadota bacterium]
MNDIASLLRSAPTAQEFSGDEWRAKIEPVTRRFLEDTRSALRAVAGSGTTVTFYRPAGARKKRQAFDYLRCPVVGFPKVDFKMTVSVGLFTAPTQALVDKLWWGLYAYGSDSDPTAKLYLPDVRRFVNERMSQGTFGPTHRATTGGWGPLLIEPCGEIGPEALEKTSRLTLVDRIVTDLARLQDDLA